MGSGTWTRDAFKEYSCSIGRTVTASGDLDSSYSHQDLYTSTRLQPELNPYNVMRECRDSDEHPNTIPVILALDVTGSMGSAAAECAKKLNEIMTTLYEKVADVEFMIMAIGDLAYDRAPIQISQFESDIRIAEQLDKVYFEGGGGGNSYESYTAAWYMGARHTKLDCWKRGKKGIIITLGDEPLNPYLPVRGLSAATGDSLQAAIETDSLYREASEKYDIFHLAVADKATSWRHYNDQIRSTFGKYLDDYHLRTVSLNHLPAEIIDIVSGGAVAVENTEPIIPDSAPNEISW